MKPGLPKKEVINNATVARDDKLIIATVHATMYNYSIVGTYHQKNST